MWFQSSKNGVMNLLHGIKIESAAGRQFFYQSEKEICEKTKFFTPWPPARKRRDASGWVQQVKLLVRMGQQMPC